MPKRESKKYKRGGIEEEGLKGKLFIHQDWEMDMKDSSLDWGQWQEKVQTQMSTW